MKVLISKFKVTSEILNKLSEGLTKNLFKMGTTIVYHGQKPLAAIFIHSGLVTIKKNNKIKETIGPGHLIAYDEFLNKKSLAYDIEVSAATELSWVGPETLESLISSRPH